MDFNVFEGLVIQFRRIVEQYNRAVSFNEKKQLITLSKLLARKAKDVVQERLKNASSRIE